MNQTKCPRNKRIGDYRIYFKKRIGNPSLFSRFLGKNQSTNDLVAIKIVPKNLLLEQDQLQHAFLKEWNIIKEIKERHVLQYKDIIQTKNNIYIIQQLTNQRSLHLVSLSQDEVLQILYQICLGFSELKKHGIQFNSLKASAVLFKQNIVKLEGFSCIYFGTHHDYLPPEFVNNVSSTELRQEQKLNIWGLGIIAYKLLIGSFPSGLITNLTNQQQGLENQINFPTETPVSQITKDFIRKCLRNKSEERMSIEEAVGHKAFQYLDNRNKTQLYCSYGFKKKKTF